MRKRLRKKKRKMFLESLQVTGDPGFERFSQELCEVVAEQVGVPVEVLLMEPGPGVPEPECVSPSSV